MRKKEPLLCVSSILVRYWTIVFPVQIIARNGHIKIVFFFDFNSKYLGGEFMIRSPWVWYPTIVRSPMISDHNYDVPLSA